VPKAVKGVVKRHDFVCPAGYKKCPHCCDIEEDCKCDNKCASKFPRGFDCALVGGQDQYTTVSLGSKCPGGYTECSKTCDLNPDCKQDQTCMASPPKGFRCTVPKRHNGDGTAMQGGRVEAFRFKKLSDVKSFDQAEAACKAKGGHLMSIHSNEDYKAVNHAILRARISKAAFIGGYEYKGKEGAWRWTDGTVMDKKMLNGLMMNDNFGQNEDQMIFCSSRCVNSLLGGPNACKNCVGLHDWGNRERHDTSGVGGYVCRLAAKRVGHVTKRDPFAQAFYRDAASTGKSTGWSNPKLTKVQSLGYVHGPWGKECTKVSRSLRVPSSSKGSCGIHWRSWAVDSRDGEIDMLKVNNKVVWRARAQMAFRAQADGSRCQRGWKEGPKSFPNPWHGTNAPACYLDRTVSVPCKANSIMKIEFSSGVDEAVSNEAWAFSDFSATLRTPRTKKPKRAPCSIKNFAAETNKMSKICCTSRSGFEAECSGGMPQTCDSKCHKAVYQFYHYCRGMIKKTKGMTSTMTEVLQQCRDIGKNGH